MEIPTIAFAMHDDHFEIRPEVERMAWDLYISKPNGTPEGAVMVAAEFFAEVRRLEHERTIEWKEREG